MPLLLPNNLKCLSSFTGEGIRWATGGVCLETTDDGKRYTATATDCKVLVSVSGKTLDISDHPTPQPVKDAPNGAVKGLIPSELWSSMMGASAKSAGARAKPILKSVAVAMSDTPNTVMMGWTNGTVSASQGADQCSGRFPPWRDLWPTKKPLAMISLHRDNLVAIGKTLDQMRSVKDDADLSVLVEFHGSEKPLVLRWDGADESQKAEMLVMPLSEGRDADGNAIPKGLADECHPDNVAYLKEQIAEMTLTIAKQADEIDGLKNKAS